MQTAARRAELPLDRMALAVEVTKKTREEISYFFIILNYLHFQGQSN